MVSERCVRSVASFLSTRKKSQSEEKCQRMTKPWDSEGCRPILVKSPNNELHLKPRGDTLETSVFIFEYTKPYTVAAKFCTGSLFWSGDWFFGLHDCCSDIDLNCKRSSVFHSLMGLLPLLPLLNHVLRFSFSRVSLVYADSWWTLWQRCFLLFRSAEYWLVCGGFILLLVSEMSVTKSLVEVFIFGRSFCLFNYLKLIGTSLVFSVLLIFFSEYQDDSGA